jgi:hypothetical protein
MDKPLGRSPQCPTCNEQELELVVLPPKYDDARRLRLHSSV